MKTLYALELQRRIDFRIKIADEKQALEAWRFAENDESLEDSYLATQLGERLGVLLEFLAGSTTDEGKAARTWCLLYAVRPDLVGHESIQDAADRFGISQQRLCQVLQRFKTITGFSYSDRTGKRSLEKQRKCTEAMNAARTAKAIARRRLEAFAERELEAVA